MKHMRGIFSGGLTVGGFILHIVFAGIFQLLPLYVIGLSFWLSVIVVSLLNLIPSIGTILSIGSWIWGLVVIINGPQNKFAVAYYILFALYMGFFIKTVIIDTLRSNA